MAVFAGGWTLEAAEALAADVGDVLDVLDRLTALVSKSLIVADVRRDHARYRLLETVRQYAIDKLDAADEERSARGAHMRWYVRLAETAEPHLRGRAGDLARSTRGGSRKPPRGAVVGARRTGHRVGDGLRLAAALRWFWFTRGRPAEGRAWLERGLALADGVTAGGARHGAGHRRGAGAQPGRLRRRARLQDAALEVWRAEGDRRRMAAALSTLGIIAKAQGEHDRAARCSTRRWCWRARSVTRRRKPPC